jgi:uncharacterized membrane-anchored protein
VNSGARRARLFPEPLAAKVPEITLLFWVVKLLTTCGGEAVSDYLALGNRQVGAVVETGRWHRAGLAVQDAPPRRRRPLVPWPTRRDSHRGV